MSVGETVKMLSDDEVEKVARRVRGNEPLRLYLAEFGIDVDALCQTVRALRAERDSWQRVSERLEEEKIAMREQLSGAENELRRRQNGDELPSNWDVIDFGDGFPNLYLYSRSDIVAQARARLGEIQSQLAQVTQEWERLRRYV